MLKAYFDSISILQENYLYADFVDNSFDKLSPLDSAQEQWKLVYPVAHASCILSMYFLASRESGAEIPWWKLLAKALLCACVHLCAGRTRLSVLLPWGSFVKIRCPLPYSRPKTGRGHGMIQGGIRREWFWVFNIVAKVIALILFKRKQESSSIMIILSTLYIDIYS